MEGGKDSDRITAEKKKGKKKKVSPVEGGAGWMAAGKVSPGDGEHAGSKKAVCPPCCLAVSPTVMKLNEATGSAQSVQEKGDHQWPEEKRATKKKVHR